MSALQLLETYSDVHHVLYTLNHLLFRLNVLKQCDKRMTDRQTDRQTDKQTDGQKKPRVKTCFHYDSCDI